MVEWAAVRVAPALTAVGVLAVYGSDWPLSACMALAALLGGALAAKGRQASHLARWGRTGLDLGAVLFAAVVTSLVAAIDGSPLLPEAVLAAVALAAIVQVGGRFLTERLRASIPIRVAIVGPAALGEAFARELREVGADSHRIVGVIAEPGADPPDADLAEGLSFLGELGDVRDVTQRHGIDLLVVAPEGPRLEVFGLIASCCLDLPVRMVEASFLYEELHGRVPIGTITDAWFQYMLHPRYSPTPSISKRCVDVTGSVAGLLLTLPLLLSVATLVYVTGGAPVLYRQRRLGEGGRGFDMLKFRSMPVDAEPAGAVWSWHADTRTTRLGRLLRRTHIDELPQLYNVLRGDMSLVGPRPERPEFVQELEELVPYYDRRHLVKPGITGWAQVQSGYGGSHIGTAAKVSLDLYYIKRRTLAFDLMILVETVRSLFADSHLAEVTFSEAFILGNRSPLGERTLLEEAATAAEDVAA